MAPINKKIAAMHSGIAVNQRSVRAEISRPGPARPDRAQARPGPARFPPKNFGPARPVAQRPGPGPARFAISLHGEKKFLQDFSHSNIGIVKWNCAISPAHNS